MYRFIPYVRTAFEVYNWLIIIRVFLSWIPHDPHKPIFRFIYEITEPLLGFFRRLIGFRMGLDFSPVLALLAVQLMETLAVNLLRYL